MSPWISLYITDIYQKGTQVTMYMYVYIYIYIYIYIFVISI